MTKTGIDAIAFYVPKLYVTMDDLAEARNIVAEKLKKGLGLQKMAIPNVGEDAATFAANALYNLIEQNNINPSNIGRVYLGTESAVDGSKPTATYAVEIVENALSDKFGARSFKNCDILDMTFACVGAVDALHNSLDWVKQQVGRKAVVIASDLSKYELNSTGEYTQGAGAVAILVSHDPSIIEIDTTWGVASKSEGDFFKPRRSYKKIDLLKSALQAFDVSVSESEMEAFFDKSSSDFWTDKNAVVEVFKEEPVFDGQFSNACYNDRITEALEYFTAQKNIDFLSDWKHLVFHLPYAYHGRRIIFDNWLKWVKNSDNIKELETEIGTLEESSEWTKAAYKSQVFSKFVTDKIATSEIASSEIGNMYTASIFMSLLSLLSNSLNNNKDIVGDKIGFIAYGSGSKSKVFEGIVQQGWASKIQNVKLFETLETRTVVDVDTYENLHRSKQKQSVNQPASITLDYIEKEGTNYGLKRYKCNL